MIALNVTWLLGTHIALRQSLWAMWVVWLITPQEGQFLLDILRYFAWAIANGQAELANNPWLGNLPGALQTCAKAIGKAVVEALF